MTELGQQLGDGIALNPDAAQPPFPVWMALPSRWSLLDTNPGTWLRSANDLLDTTFRGSKLPAADRKTFLGFIENLVADCQSGGACVSLLMVGRREGGGAASAGIHLAFADEGVPASIGRVQDTIPRAGTRSEIESGVGPAMLQRERMTMLVPGTAQLAALTSLQIFVPIPETTWTLAIATASAYPEITDPLEALLVEIARSVRVEVPGGDGGSGSPGRAGGDEGSGSPGRAGGDGVSSSPGRAGGDGVSSSPGRADGDDNSDKSGQGGDPAEAGSAGARPDRARAQRPSDRTGPRIVDAFGSGLIVRRLGPEERHG